MIWPVLKVLVWFAAARAAGATAQAEDRPTIRLAYLVADDESALALDFTVAKFMMNTSRREILPDYDVIVDHMRFARGTSDASAHIVGAVVSKQPYAAILGPDPNVECIATSNLTATAQILQVMTCHATSLTRERYPYYFITAMRPLYDIQFWMYIASSNGWKTVIALVYEEAILDEFSRSGETFGVDYYTVLAAEDTGEAWHETSVNLILSTRSRIVMTHLTTDVVWYQLVCYIHQSRVSGLQYFMIGYQQPDWYVVDHPTSTVHCTLDEMYTALYGYIATFHTSVAPGSSGLGANFPPLNGEYQSKRHLSCLPELTVEGFYINGELLTQGILSGEIYDESSAQIIVGRAGLHADMFCLVVFALHDAIYNKGIPLSELEQHGNAGFNAVVASAQNASFQGASGLVSFQANSGTKAQQYNVVMQRALPGVSNTTYEFLATFSQPYGLDHDPVLVFAEDGVGDFHWRDGSTGLGPKPELWLFPICGNDNAELIWDSCHPCAPGKAYDALLDACRTCSPGTYQSEEAQSECVTALPGQYINNTDVPIEALPCPVGHECPQIGTVSPQLCAEGRFARDVGQEVCELCPIGRYQSHVGATGCADCTEMTAGSTTRNIASSSADACVCAEGMFLQLGATECIRCLEGMECQKGSDMRNLETGLGPYPFSLEGYMTTPVDPLRVYLCANEEHCPGGPPGTCAEQRDPNSVACGRCKKGAYEAAKVCETCGSSSALPLLVSCALATMVIAVGTLLINRDMAMTPSASVMIVVMTGVLFTSLQAMGVFNQMPIPWVEPMKSFLRFTNIFTFEVKELRVSCVMGVKPIRSFAFRQAAPLIVIPIVTTTLGLKKHAPCGIGNANTHVRLELANAVGAIYTLFFISILLSALGPFLCYKHPDSNGESALSDPSLLCFKDNDHIAMATIGCLSIATVPLPLAAACLCGVIMYPKYIAKSSSSKFFLGFRFLFFKYTPKRYYFQLIFLARSLCLCLIPAILRGQASTQLLFICLLLSVYVAVVSDMQPWRNKLSNKLDAGMNIMLLVMLMCGALFLDDTPQKGAVAALAMAGAVCVLLTASVGIGIGVWHRLVPHPFYDYFLCHHKAHAAAQTRYLKIVMQETRHRCHVFIDSDDLKQLDTLFDTVKTRVGHLVVYLTADTLKRPWCVGEIVSATRASVVITRVNTPTFVAPSEAQITEPQNYVDSVGCNLSEYHIQWEDVTRTFHSFLQTVKQKQLPTDYLGRLQFDRLAGDLLSMRATSNSRHSELKTVTFASVVLSNDPLNPEACAAGGILLAGLSRHIFQKFEHGDCILSDFATDIDSMGRLTKQASAVVVILSEGCLSALPCAYVICELELLLQCSNAAPVPVSVNIPGFVFPTPDALNEICANTPGLVSAFGNETSQFLASFFKNISILFPTHASQEALNIQSEEIMRRISLNSLVRQSHGTRSGASCRSSGSSGGSVTNHMVVAASTATASNVVSDAGEGNKDLQDYDEWLGTPPHDWEFLRC